MYVHSEETRALTDTVARIVKIHQMPLEAKVLRGEALTAEDRRPGLEAARAAGLWSLSMPADVGGPGLSLAQVLAIEAENYRCLVPVRFRGDALPPTLELQGEQRRRYLTPYLDDGEVLCMAQTEPAGGGDPANAIQTHARRTDSGWVINGSKIWISGFDEANRVFVLARTQKRAGAGAISILAVEKDNPGMTARPIPMLGGMTVHQLTFSDCEVDDLALIGEEGNGFKGAQRALTAARFNVAARAVGITQRVYEMMVEHAKMRHAFGGPLSEKQAVQAMIVDSWVELQQNRLMLFTCAEKVDRGEDARVEGGMVKMLCTEMVGRVIDRGIQILGAAGCTYESPLAHWYDLQRMARIYEGPTDVHKHRVIARHLLS